MGLGASFAIFGIVRAFAKPEPATMSQEYQEASNEFLKVCMRVPTYTIVHMADACHTATKSRPHHRHRLRGLLWQGPGPVSPQGPLNTLDNTI